MNAEAAAFKAVDMAYGEFETQRLAGLWEGATRAVHLATQQTVSLARGFCNAVATAEEKGIIEAAGEKPSDEDDALMRLKFEGFLPEQEWQER